MPRITVYVPDDLKASMDKAGDDLNWSAIAQHAIRAAISIHHLQRNPSDMTNVIERLRASKQDAEEASTASGRDCGATWARTTAEYGELNRIWDGVAASDVDLNGLQRLIDPRDEMGRHDWEAFWERHGDGDINDAFANGFASGAADLFAEVKDQI